MNVNRVARGVPTGGQFAQSARGEATLTLDPADASHQGHDGRLDEPFTNPLSIPNGLTYTKRDPSKKAHLPRAEGAPSYPQADTENTPVRPLRRGSVTLAKSEPWLAAEWNHDRNGDWTPETIAQKSNLYAHWRCENGHEWRSRINNRVAGRTGCPECFQDGDADDKRPLTESNPNLAAMWHPTRNGKLTPDKVSAASGREVWWKCANNHRFQATPHSMSTTRNRCPKCPQRIRTAGLVHGMSLGESYPVLAEQWHPTKNGDLRAKDVAMTSDEAVWWFHEECGYEWQARVINRTRVASSGCPACSGRHLDEGKNDLATTNPLAASMWHPTKNGALTASDVSLGSPKKAWFQCPKGHEWEMQIRYWKGGRTGHAGCAVCRQEEVAAKRAEQAKAAEAIRQQQYDYRTQNPLKYPVPPATAAYWHPTKNTDLDPPDHISKRSRKSAWFQCPCGHEWYSSIEHESRKDVRAAGCPKCDTSNPDEARTAAALRAGSETLPKSW